MAEGPVVLGIETSCDETGVGVVRGGTVIADVVASSMDQHAPFGGVVPEVASRAHVEALPAALERARFEADLDWSEIDAIAVTAGPGLKGALLVGTAAARGMAIALGKPLYAVNHLAAHVLVDGVEHGELPSPTVALLVSGGHTELILVDDRACQLTPLGSTLDDAVGEAFDKVARLLGLPFPGGPSIDAAAREGDPDSIAFPRGMTNSRRSADGRFDFSFSGLKTAVARWVQRQEQQGGPVRVADAAASFQEAAVDVLVSKALAACREFGAGSLVVGGGVAANSRLRQTLADRAEPAGIEVRIPRPGLCTDNGTMVAWLGHRLVAAGVEPSGLEFPTRSQLPVSEIVLRSP